MSQGMKILGVNRVRTTRERGIIDQEIIYPLEKPKKKHKELPKHITDRMALLEVGYTPEEAIFIVPTPKWRPSREYLEEQKEAEESKIQNPFV